MAATPYKGILLTRIGNRSVPSSQVERLPKGPSFRFSASDVANAQVTFDDLPGTPSTIPVPLSGLIWEDILLSAAGVDTKSLQVTKGTSQTDKILRGAAMVETLSVSPDSRNQGMRGLALEPGALYGLRQLA